MANRHKGVVAAGHEVSAGAAAEMLEDGGNAFDAVLAGLFASCVPEVVLASPGGGGHLMARRASDDTLVLYDFFVDTPMRRRVGDEIDFRDVLVDFGPASQEFHVGLGASAVPGFVPGVFAVHGDLCRLPMARIVEPAVRAARDGVVMNAFHSYLFSIVEPVLMPAAKASIFGGEDGALLREGDVLHNPGLAAMFEELAREGPRLFVEGDVGQEIVRQSRECGGHLTLDDLLRYEVVRRAPIACRYRGHRVSLNPIPAASGSLIGFGLALIEAGVVGGQVPPVVLANVMAETNDVRRRYGDNLSGVLDQETVNTYLSGIETHAPAPRGTTHISVIDADGNAAAATVSNGEGNGVEVGGHGFMLNNMLGEEDLNPDGLNQWEPASRMSTMMAPTLLEAHDGALTAMGSGGSNRIRSAVLQVVLNLVDRGMALEDAVEAPRLHFEKCGTLSFEDCYGDDTRAVLVAAFPDAHAWPERNMFFGGVHSVRRRGDGTLEGAGDPRRAGVCMVV